MRAWKVTLAAVAAIAALAAAVASVAAWLGDRKLQRSVVVRVVPIALANDAAAIRAGRPLYEERGCAQCHGDDGAGRTVTEDGGLVVRAPNITQQPGSATAGYSEGDWVRAIRHGVNPSGHALLYMPSDEYNRLNDAQVAAIVAYVRNLPPLEGPGALVRLPFHMKVLYGLGLMQDASEKIDHRRPPSP